MRTLDDDFAVTEYFSRRLRVKAWVLVALVFALPAAFAHGTFYEVWVFCFLASLGLRIVDDLACSEYEKSNGDFRFYHAGYSRHRLLISGAILLGAAGTILVHYKFLLIPYAIFLVTTGALYFFLRRSKGILAISLLKYPAGILAFWPLEKSLRITVASFIFIFLLTHEFRASHCSKGIPHV